MSVATGPLSQTLEVAHDRVRRAGDVVSSGAIWVLVAALFVWAALAETQLFAVGIIVGSVLALGAIGLTLIYGILRFANFAHGDLLTFGAYIATFAYISGGDIGPLSFGFGMIVAIVFAGLCLAAVAIAVDRIVFRTLRQRRSDPVIFAVASLGIALIVRAVVLLIWGPQPRVYFTGVQFAEEIGFGVKVRPDQMFIVATAFVLVALVFLLLYRTKLGKAMRATSDNPDLARASGIDTERVILWTWSISSVLVAVGGVLLGIQSQVTPGMGFNLLIPLFAATILGGIGSPHGALLGALVVAVSQEASTGVDLPWPPGWGPGYKPAVAFAVLILMLTLRPRGLFGARR
jgi:branched-chain amino acid transport system permease protein/neutral amino acid transport system permease protein